MKDTIPKVTSPGENLDIHRNYDNSLIKLKSVSKHFVGVTALDNVDFDLKAGEVHCLIGENGAGKSTLVKILAGVHQPDGGTLEVNGKSVVIANPHNSQQLGLSFIFQELSVVNGLSVAENIVLGCEPLRGVLFDYASAYKSAIQMMGKIGFGHVDPSAMVSTLSVAEKQAVMIARALFLEANVIVMDEPTSSLDSDEVEELFNVVRQLRSEGKGIVYISHRMHELFKIADRVTVFKDGAKVGTYNIADVDERDLVRLMVGRQMNVIFPPKERIPGDVVLRVNNLNNNSLCNVSFNLREGEILGIAGLVGAGRTELLRAIFGVDKRSSGTVEVGESKKSIQTAYQAILAGVALVPEDRRSQGIVPQQSVHKNLAMIWSQFPDIRGEFSREDTMVNTMIERLQIKTPSPEQIISYLSGGNQQKVVFGKWLGIKSKVLLLDEPTRGIDVGAKLEIYRLIDLLAKDGLGIILVSSELPEVLGLADRILVVRSGKVVAELDGDASEEDVISASMLSEEC
jgi:ABC-type sugar transport system ATPase subunit